MTKSICTAQVTRFERQLAEAMRDEDLNRRFVRAGYYTQQLRVWRALAEEAPED